MKAFEASCYIKYSTVEMRKEYRTRKNLSTSWVEGFSFLLKFVEDVSLKAPCLEHDMCLEWEPRGLLLHQFH